MIFPGRLGVLSLFFTAASVSALSGITCVQIDPKVVNAQKSSWTVLGGITFLPASDGTVSGGSVGTSSVHLDYSSGTLTLGNGGGSRTCTCVQLKSGGLCYWLNGGDTCTANQPTALNVEIYGC